MQLSFYYLSHTKSIKLKPANTSALQPSRQIAKETHVTGSEKKYIRLIAHFTLLGGK